MGELGRVRDDFVMREDFDNGKYTVIFDKGGLRALRYGEEWRNLVGDSLVLAMLQEVETMRAKFKALLEASNQAVRAKHKRRKKAKAQ